MSDNSDVLYPTITLHTDGAQRAARGEKKKQKSSNLSTVRGGFQPRGLIVLRSSNIDFLPRRLPSQEVCLCALESGEVCVWCEKGGSDQGPGTCTPGYAKIRIGSPHPSK